MFEGLDLRELLNSIIEFIKEVIAGVQAALDGVVKTPGYANPENYPDDFQPATEA